MPASCAGGLDLLHRLHIRRRLHSFERRGRRQGRRRRRLGHGLDLHRLHIRRRLHSFGRPGRRRGRRRGRRHGTDGSDLIYWSMVLVDVTGASEVPPKNICHPSASPAPSLLRVVVARVRPLSQSCSSPTRRPDQEVDARRGVVNEHSCNTPPATRRVLNQITTEMTRQGWTLHIDTFETFSLNSAFQRLGYA